jgi:hypothetical protein
MVATISSEFRKFFTTRLWWGMAIGTFVAAAAFAGLFGALASRTGLGDPAQGGLPPMSDHQIAVNVYSSGVSVGYLLTLAIGVLTIGSEYRHKTMTSTFLATPRRVTVMWAKVISLLGIGGLYGVVFIIGSVAVGATVLSVRGMPAFAGAGSIVRTLVLILLVLGLWELIGLGAGILIPNQVAALLIAIGVAWIVEPIAGALLSTQSWGAGVAQFLPSRATTAVLQSYNGGGEAEQLSWWAGALVLAAYAALMAGIGSALTVRRDIS